MIDPLSLQPAIVAKTVQRASAERPTEGSLSPAPVAPAVPVEDKARAERGRPEDEDVERTLDRISQRLLRTDARLLIDADEATSNFIYKLIERGSGEIVRQYPSEKILEMLRALKEIDERNLDRTA